MALQGLAFPESTRTTAEREEQFAELATTHRPGAQRNPRVFIVRASKQLVASAMVFPRTIAVESNETTTLALASVCSAPAHRGKSFGRAVVQAAFKLVDDGEFPHSLFQTSEDIRPFYEKLGACKIRNRIVNSLGDPPTANPFKMPEIMCYATDPVCWGEAPIDLLGPGY